MDDDGDGEYLCGRGDDGGEASDGTGEYTGDGGEAADDTGEYTGDGALPSSFGEPTSVAADGPGKSVDLVGGGEDGGDASDGANEYTGDASDVGEGVLVYTGDRHGGVLGSDRGDDGGEGVCADQGTGECTGVDCTDECTGDTTGTGDGCIGECIGESASSLLPAVQSVALKPISPSMVSLLTAAVVEISSDPPP